MAELNSLRAIVIDDERNARENLVMLLDEFCPQIKVIATAGGVEEARELIESTPPDVLFLDIRMPSGAEGFDLLDQIDHQQFLVVFVTAFRDYAIEALNANAVHYLMKPIDITELTLAVDKVVEQSARFRKDPQQYDDYRREINALVQHLSLQQQRIAIHHSKGIKLIKPAEIAFVSADGNCSHIQLTDGSTFLDTRTLKTYDTLLPAKVFFRIHRSHVVNLLEVKEMIKADGNPWVKMSGGQKLPVSRTRFADFLKAIQAG